LRELGYAGGDDGRSEFGDAKPTDAKQPAPSEPKKDADDAEDKASGKQP
jgi:hypothetical protein